MSGVAGRPLRAGVGVIDLVLISRRTTGGHGPPRRGVPLACCASREPPPSSSPAEGDGARSANTSFTQWYGALIERPRPAGPRWSRKITVPASPLAQGGYLSRESREPIGVQLLPAGRAKKASQRASVSRRQLPRGLPPVIPAGTSRWVSRQVRKLLCWRRFWCKDGQHRYEETRRGLLYGAAPRQRRAAMTRRAVAALALGQARFHRLNPEETQGCNRRQKLRCVG